MGPALVSCNSLYIPHCFYRGNLLTLWAQFSDRSKKNCWFWVCSDFYLLGGTISKLLIWWNRDRKNSIFQFSCWFSPPVCLHYFASYGWSFPSHMGELRLIIMMHLYLFLTLFCIPVLEVSTHDLEMITGFCMTECWEKGKMPYYSCVMWGIYVFRVSSHYHRSNHYPYCSIHPLWC